MLVIMNLSFRSLFRIGIAFGLYVLVGALSHWVIYPEAPVPRHLYPKAGDELHNKVAGEHVRFVETGSRTTIDVTLAPGGAIPVAHTHGTTEEVFSIRSGQIGGLSTVKLVNLAQATSLPLNRVWPMRSITLGRRMRNSRS